MRLERHIQSEWGGWGRRRRAARRHAGGGGRRDGTRAATAPCHVAALDRDPRPSALAHAADGRSATRSAAGAPARVEGGERRAQRAGGRRRSARAQGERAVVRRAYRPPRAASSPSCHRAVAGLAAPAEQGGGRRTVQGEGGSVRAVTRKLRHAPKRGSRPWIPRTTLPAANRQPLHHTCTRARQELATQGSVRARKTVRPVAPRRTESARGRKDDDESAHPYTQPACARGAGARGR